MRDDLVALSRALHDILGKKCRCSWAMEHGTGEPWDDGTLYDVVGSGMQCKTRWQTERSSTSSKRAVDV